jgi:hypothetical protein
MAGSSQLAEFCVLDIAIRVRRPRSVFKTDGTAEFAVFEKLLDEMRDDKSTKNKDTKKNHACRH